MYLVQPAHQYAAASGRLNLEQVYSTCLEKILEGEPLAKVLTLYLHFLEQHTPGHRFAILQHIHHSATLQLLTAPSLPEVFLKTVRRVLVGDKHTACGQAASTLTPYFIENLAAYPHWQDFSEDIAAADITCYWSFPLIDDNRCIGTLLITGSDKHSPDLPTVAHYQAVAANIVKVFSYCEQQQGRTSVNWTLQKQVSQTEQALHSLRSEHDKLLVRHHQAVTQLVHQPLPKSFHSMACGLIDEINAQLNVVHTTLTFQNVLTEQNRRNVSLKQLSKEGLNQFHNSMIRSGSSGLGMLGQARERIRELADYIELMTVNPVQDFPVSATVGAIAGFIADSVPHFALTPCLNIEADFSFSLPTGCFTQVLSELLLNVYQHAYPNENHGRMWVSASTHNVNGTNTMQLVIEDEGRGIPRTVLQKLAGAKSVSHNVDTDAGGLDRCQRQVKSGLNGTMHVQHRRGGGSRVILMLPFQKRG